VGPSAGLDIMGKNLLPLLRIETQFLSRPVRGQLLYRLGYTDSSHCCSVLSRSKGADCTFTSKAGFPSLSQAVLGVTVLDWNFIIRLS
jgi:hypothetical protein